MNNLFEFLAGAKTAYHTVELIRKRLSEEGFSQLCESEKWDLKEGGKYFVIRGGSSVIAFVNNGGGFVAASVHSDFPAFRVKGTMSGAYLRLDTEKYGGMINYTWLDRPLGIAGRVAVRCEDGISMRTVDLGKRVVIPSVAIHMRRDVNDNLKLSAAKDMYPLAGIDVSEADFEKLVARAAGVEPCDVISSELFLYNADKPKIIGLSEGLVISPRIDDIGCVFSAVEAFVAAKSLATPVLAVFNNEEVGSETRQGAASTFLYDTLRRICGSEEEYLRRIASSFAVSADNAHAVHPNYPELADKNNAPVLGGGIVIKYNSNQRYATDSVSDAVFRGICHEAGVKYQTYYNRADLPGGSTLGSISATRVSVPTVDIGLPQLAMHSASETAAICDVEDMVKALTVYYSCKLEFGTDGIKTEFSKA